MKNRNITYYYPYPWSTGYDLEFTHARFSVLKNLDFKSVLDIGSGKCNLLSWLRKNGYDVQYDPVDIRKEALEICDCKTYTEIPNKKYDLVCLFGTVTYNIDGDTLGNKQILIDLLDKASMLSDKYILFTVIKSEILEYVAYMMKKQFVSYTKKEVKELAEKYGSCTILDDVDPDEHIVICEIDNGKTNS